MEATHFISSSPKFLRHPLMLHAGGRRGRSGVAVKAGRRGEESYWDSFNVDESMIVLRMRIKEIKMLEKSKSGDDIDGEDDEMKQWMEWEKEYYENYNEDVCEVMGLLQNYLLDVRPCLGLATLAFVLISVIISTGFAFFHLAMGIACALFP
ncbi:hypothetical protein M5689_007176 [Euphorbia peplus]|nr:hypothetical protein M5689_007176 [Euphorbia peplus]